ncbi:ABC-type Fe3+ transport system, permease component [Microbacterium sp. C448]|uniref:ABC transporter permease n=1 Tax=Microbacterium sp. HA-8 TaxID=3234200 RepID=UPI0003DE310B|nr:ABC-type Fe3+ transport system, permease component [Microbacterium sp. C448]
MTTINAPAPATSSGRNGDPDPPTRKTTAEAVTRRKATKRGPSPFAVVILILLGGLILVPVAMVFFGAFQSAAPGLPGTTFSLRAIMEVYGTTAYLGSLIGTLLMALSVAVLAVVFGALAAWILARTDVRLRAVLELGVIVPLFISPFIGAVAWNMLGAPRSGIINVNLRWIFGTDATFIDIGTVPGVIFVMLLYFLPYTYMLISASLKNMDPGLEEASYMNGRGIVATAMKVTLPIVRPSLTAAFFMIAVFATGIFAIPAALGLDTGFSPLAVQVYRKMTVFPSDPPAAAAIGTLIFWFTLAGIYFYRRSIRNSARFVTVGGKATRPRVVKLGWARWPVTILVALYGFLAAVLPYAAIILISLSPYTITDFRKMQFSLDSLWTVVTSPDVTSALLNTVWIALLAPTVAVLIGLGVAYITVRERGRIATIIDYISNFPMAVPGIVFATGIIWLYVRTPLYATLALLIITLVATYMPQATRFAATGLMQVDGSLEEAARMSGASKFRAITTVTMPLVAPSLMSAWVLLFIFSSREVNEAVIVAGPRSQPLSVLAWNYVENGSLNQAAVVGLLMSLVMLAGLILARYVFRVRLTSSQL